jgi:Protein tyrosine phosphatase-like protein, PTPLA
MLPCMFTNKQLVLLLTACSSLAAGFPPMYMYMFRQRKKVLSNVNEAKAKAQ